MPTPTATPARAAAPDHDPRPYVRAIATRSGLPTWLDWRVNISTRRTRPGATVDPAGTDTPVKVTFHVPAGADPDDIVSAVARMRPKLTALAADVRDRGVFVSVKELVSGEGFPFVGTHYRLNVVDDAPHSIVDGPGPSTWSGIRTWQLTLRRADADAATIIEWYKTRGRMWLDKTVPAMAERMGVPAGLRWVVRPDTEMRGAWARYRFAERLIEVSWVVFQMPRETVEWIIWHELAHAAVGGSGHGKAWQAACRRIDPNWRERNTAAREANGLTLWFGALSHATVRTVPMHDGPAPGTADAGVPVDADPSTWTAGPRPPAADGAGPAWSPETDTGATFVRYGKQPRVGDHIATGSHGHGVCPVVKVRECGQRVTVTTPGGKRREISRAVQGSWVIMTPDAPADDPHTDDQEWGTVL